MSNYMRNRKTLSSVADAYREMYATPNEDILNEELIDSLIEDVHEEEIEDIAEYLDEDENFSRYATIRRINSNKIREQSLKQ